MVSPRALASWFAAVLLCGCPTAPSEPVTPPPDLTVVSIVVTATSNTVVEGGSLQLSALARNAAGATLPGVTFAWSSGNSEILTVSPSGVATAKSAGGTTVTASASGRSGTLEITVAPDLAVSTITLTAPSSTVTEGSTVQLAAAAKNAMGAVVPGVNFTWSIGNPDLASVTSGGLLTAVKAGTTSVTASASGKTGAMTITIAPDLTVASITVTAASSSVMVGNTVQLSATARNAAGSTLSGVTVAWAVGNAELASVNASGLVTATKAGTTSISATHAGSGKTGSADITITPLPMPVATVAVTASATDVFQSKTLQLTATTKDASGNTLVGRSVEWASSNTAVATVSNTGLLTAVAVGNPVTITATSEGKTGTLSITVKPRVAARVSARQRLVHLDVAGSSQLEVDAYDADNVAIPHPTVQWTSLTSAIASVSTTGSVQGVAEGQSAIVSRVDNASDTTWVAVLGPTSLFASALVTEKIRAEAKRGTAVSIPVIVDLSKVSPTGDLGSIQFDLDYDPAVLTFDSAATQLAGSASHNVPTPGKFRFTFAHTAAQGKASFPLVTIAFRVSSTAVLGSTHILGLKFTANPTSTAFVAYALPVALGGGFTIIAP